MTSPNETHDSYSPYDDHRRPLKNALKAGAAGLVVLAVASIIGWGVAQGMPGVWGAVLGAVIGGGYVLLTAISVLITIGKSLGFTGAVILGGWLAKVVLVMLIFALLDPLTFYHRGALVVTTLIALFLCIGLEVWQVSRTKVVSVTPQKGA